MDKRQEIAQVAMTAVAALSPRAALEQEWEVVQAACYQASAAYLAVAGRMSSATAESACVNRATGAEIAEVATQLESALAGLDAFYERNRLILDSAANSLSSLTVDADAVIREAHEAGQSLATVEPNLQGYPSVLGAREQLDRAAARLQAAREQTNIAATMKAVHDVRLAIVALNEALVAAPQREEQARRTVASVRTRIDAARTRAGGLPALVSVLLREFNARSSADLVNNDKASQAHLERAEALLTQAVAAREAHRPEDALELAKRARSVLAEAERDVDEVSDRLALLRDVRAEPDRRAREVRFRLRDAQRLAVDRGVVPEWGSVLDAQSDRIDRIVGAIEGVHPDYWAYHRSLGEVSEFIVNVVNRIRQGAVR
ncbi:MAG: hypothetical protein U0R81_16380 [Mycobacterium sp.]